MLKYIDLQHLTMILPGSAHEKWPLKKEKKRISLIVHLRKLDTEQNSYQPWERVEIYGQLANSSLWYAGLLFFKPDHLKICKFRSISYKKLSSNHQCGSLLASHSTSLPSSGLSFQGAHGFYDSIYWYLVPKMPDRSPHSVHEVALIGSIVT